MHVGIILQRFNGIPLEKIGNWALSTAHNFLDHPTARRDLVAFVVSTFVLLLLALLLGAH